MPRKPEIHYRLKPSKEKSRLIYMDFAYNRKRLKYSFGQFVEAKDWNDNKEIVKNKEATTKDGKFYLNELLNNLKKVCEKKYNESLPNGIPAPEVLILAMKAFINQNHNSDIVEDGKPTLFKLIDRFEKGEIKNRGKEKSINTIKTYTTCKNHLLDFQEKQNIVLDFDSITLDFYYNYVTFLKNRDITTNAIGKDISIIKVFMGEAVDLGHTNNIQFKHKKFFVTREDAENVYLTEQELNKLYRCAMPTKIMEEQRDLFIIGAMTGLRLSDYSNIKVDNIVEMEGEKFIKLIAKKTKGLVIIPCNPVVLEIFNKYDDKKNKVPNAVSDQYFNRLLKDACETAKLNETGRLAKAPELELYKCEKIIKTEAESENIISNYSKYLDSLGNLIIFFFKKKR